MLARRFLLTLLAPQISRCFPGICGRSLRLMCGALRLPRRRRPLVAFAVFVLMGGAHRSLVYHCRSCRSARIRRVRPPGVCLKELTGRWLDAPQSWALLLIIGGTGFYYSGIINSHFRPNSGRTRCKPVAVARVSPATRLSIGCRLRCDPRRSISRIGRLELDVDDLHRRSSTA